MTRKNDEKRSPVITNRRARFDYEIVETFEGGIELTGCEVKSLRNGGGSLTDTFARPRDGQLWLNGMHIKHYLQGGHFNTDPYRPRRMLLHRKEIDRIVGSISTRGMTLIPLKVYFNDRGWAKITLGLAKGKKAHDKRNTIRERDVQRDLQREYKLR